MAEKTYKWFYDKAHTQPIKIGDRLRFEFKYGKTVYGDGQRLNLKEDYAKIVRLSDVCVYYEFDRVQTNKGFAWKYKTDGRIGCLRKFEEDRNIEDLLVFDINYKFKGFGSYGASSFGDRVFRLTPINYDDLVEIEE